MSYLAQGLQAGFGQGFSAYTQRQAADKLKAERDAERALQLKRQAVEDARYEREANARDNEYTNRQLRQMVEDQRWEEQQKREMARDARDFEFKREAYADQRMDATLDRARQTRMDWTAEQNDQQTRPLLLEKMAQDARMAKMQADTIGQPRETLTFDPLDQSGEPKRTITGPAGSLGAFAKPGAGTGKGFNSIEEVQAAYKAGTLPRAEAERILREQFNVAK